MLQLSERLSPVNTNSQSGNPTVDTHQQLKRKKRYVQLFDFFFSSIAMS